MTEQIGGQLSWCRYDGHATHPGPANDRRCRRRLTASPHQLRSNRGNATVFASDDGTTPEEFPRLWNISVGFTKRAILRPVTPARPEYVTITLPPAQIRIDESIRGSVAVAEWNWLWEAAQFRRRFFDEEAVLTRPRQDC